MVEQAHVRQRHEEHHENGGRDGYDNRAVGPASRSLLANVCERELGRPSGPELEDVSHGLCHTVLSGAHLIISVASSPAPRLGVSLARSIGPPCCHKLGTTSEPSSRSRVIFLPDSRAVNPGSAIRAFGRVGRSRQRAHRTTGSIPRHRPGA